MKKTYTVIAIEPIKNNKRHVTIQEQYSKRKPETITLLEIGGVFHGIPDKEPQGGDAQLSIFLSDKSLIELSIGDTLEYELKPFDEREGTPIWK